jgi:hypothetical protein
MYVSYGTVALTDGDTADFSCSRVDQMIDLSPPLPALSTALRGKRSRRGTSSLQGAEGSGGSKAARAQAAERQPKPARSASRLPPHAAS